MNFETPQAFLLFLAVLAAAGLYWLTFRWKERTLRLFAGGSAAPLLTASVSKPRQIWKAALLLLALSAIVVGLTRPYIGEELKPPRPENADLLLVLDVSQSMAAQDIHSSRLALAKEEVLALIERLQGDRVGLVVFAGSAALRFPLTYDYDVAKVLVRAVEVDSAPAPGSHLAEGIRTALLALRQSEAPIRAILLLSDGEDLGSEFQQAAAEAVKEGIPVHAVGLGTAQGGPIPVRTPGAAGFTLKRDRSGQIVQTRLNEAPLRLLAERTEGSYQTGSESGRDLQEVYERIIQRSVSTLPPTRARSNDLSAYFVLLALFALLVELLVSERRSPAPLPRVALAVLPVVLLLSTTACTEEGDTAFDLNELGAQRFSQSRYAEALDHFRQAQVQRPELPQLNFNAGGALYKIEEFRRSLRETQRALSAEPSELRARAHFNRGNAYFQLERYQDAFEEYRKSLLDDPDDLDAKINLELALRKMTAQNQPGAGHPQTQQDPQPPGPDQQQDTRDNRAQQDDDSERDRESDLTEELQRSLREADRELTIEEALRILDVLREREYQLQRRYRQEGTDDFSTERPEKDW